MTTSAITQVAVAGAVSVSAVAYGVDVIDVTAAVDGTINLHVAGDAVDALTPLPWAGSKDRVSAVVIGDVLHVAWGESGNVVYARWNLATSSVHTAPTTLFAGSRPVIVSYLANRLMIHYVDASGNHARKTSVDGGVNWSFSSTIDAKVSTDVADVDVHMSPLDASSASWSNTKAAS